MENIRKFGQKFGNFCMGHGKSSMGQDLAAKNVEKMSPKNGKKWQENTGNCFTDFHFHFFPKPQTLERSPVAHFDRVKGSFT